MNLFKRQIFNYMIRVDLINKDKMKISTFIRNLFFFPFMDSWEQNFAKLIEYLIYILINKLSII